MSGDTDLEMIEQIIVKPYFTTNERETQDRQEIRQLLADQNTTSIPASAPLEEGALRDPEHIRIHQELSKSRSRSINALPESRQTINNQLVAPFKQKF